MLVTVEALTTANSYVRYLESNTFVLQLGEVRLLSDPVLSQLDFGIPWLYKGLKRYIDDDFELKNEAALCDTVLLSQGFDDHAHTPTLKKIRMLRPDMQYICPPSALSILVKCGISESNIKCLAHGEKHHICKGKTQIEVTATKGALLGPPWQIRENGWVLKPIFGSSSFPSIYYEPHCMYDETEVNSIGPIDVAITPIVSQELPAYTLVGGGESALKLLKALKAKTVIPMMNGELEQSGILAALVRQSGSIENFKTLIGSTGGGINIATGPAGELISLPF